MSDRNWFLWRAGFYGMVAAWHMRAGQAHEAGQWAALATSYANSAREAE